jgi:polyadenylate-binding protein
VHYENPEAADAAIEQVNGMLLMGKKVFVGPFQPRKLRGEAGQQKFTNIFVKDLPLDLTDEEMEKAFAVHGEITSSMVRRKEDGTSLGFGFINYANVDAARNAVEQMNGAEMKGQRIYVARAQKKAEREAQLKRQFEERKQRYAESNVFVKNLDETTDDVKLKEHFNQFGEVVSCKVMRDDKGLSRGFGFVCFNTPEEAHKAIADPLNKVLNGKPLYVALAQRKDVRSAQLQAQYAHRAAGRGIAPPMMQFMMGPQPGQRVGAPPYPQPYPQVNMMQQVRGAPRWQQGGPQPGAAPAQAGRGGQPYGGQYPVAAGGKTPAQYMLNVGAANAPAQPVPEAAPPHPSLADLSEKDRKQVLGEFLYPKIEVLLKTEVGGDPSETGKITGMLLESLDHGELVHLLESPAELKSRVAEAIQVLREHLANTAH